MDLKWVKIRSWHALRPDDHFGPTAYCGKQAKDGAEIVDKLPASKSCESCLRITGRIQDDMKGVE